MADDPNKEGKPGSDKLPGGAMRDDEINVLPGITYEKILYDLKGIMTSVFQGKGGGGGGGEDGGGGGGRDSSGNVGGDLLNISKANQLINSLDNLRDKTDVFIGELAERNEELRKSIRDSGDYAGFFDPLQIELDSLKRTFDTYNTSLASLRNSYVEFRSDIISGTYAVKRFKEALEQATDLASRGLGGLKTRWDNIWQAGVNLSDTLQTIMADSGKAFMISGKGVVEFGKALRDQRDFLRDEIDAYGFLDYKQQNEFLQGIYTQMVRQGVQTTFSSREIALTAAEQLEYFSEIARNTGRTVEEIIKSREEDFATIDEALARGFISEDAAKEFKRITTELENLGLGDLAKTIASSIGKAGSGGLSGTEFSEGQIAAGELAFFQEVMRLQEAGVRLSREELARLYVEYTQAIEGLPRAVSDGMTASIRNGIREWLKNVGERGPVSSAIVSFLGRLSDFYNNRLSWVGDILAGVSAVFGAWNIAQYAHIVAMVAHTRALLLNSPMRLLNAFSIITKPLLSISKFIGAFTGITGMAHFHTVAGYLGVMSRLFAVNIVAPIFAIFGIARDIWDSLTTTKEEMDGFKDDFEQDWLKKFAAVAQDLSGGILALAVGVVAAVFFGAAAWPAILAGSVAYGLFEALDWFFDGALSKWFGKMMGQVAEYLNSTKARDTASTLWRVTKQMFSELSNWLIELYEGVMNTFKEGLRSIIGNDLMSALGFDSVSGGNRNKVYKPKTMADNLEPASSSLGRSSGEIAKLLEAIPDDRNPGGMSDLKFSEALYDAHKKDRDYYKELVNLLRDLIATVERAPAVETD